MSVRERILMLRLLEKLQQHPAYATILGVEASAPQPPTPSASQPKEQ